MMLQYISDGVNGQSVVSFVIDHTCATDLQCSDGDGDVGITDFLELLANWGECP